jgi:hypothetical protein
VLGPNIRFFVEHGVKGVFEQGAYQSYGSEMAELRAWVLAKLLWEPRRDPQQLIDEFLEGYYGQAAGHIRAYLKLTHDAVEASGDPLGCYSSPTAKFLSLATLSEAVKRFKAAESAVGTAETPQPGAALAADAPSLRLRVETAELPVLYAFLVRWEPLRKEAEQSQASWPLPDSLADVYARFMDIAKRASVTMISEGGALDHMARLVPAAVTPPAK